MSGEGGGLPIERKVAWTYAEVEAVGLCKERALRKMVSMGKVKKAVLRVGRSVKFLRVELIRELGAA